LFSARIGIAFLKLLFANTSDFLQQNDITIFIPTENGYLTGIPFLTVSLPTICNEITIDSTKFDPEKVDRPAIINLAPNHSSQGSREGLVSQTGQRHRHGAVSFLKALPWP
jgi:hypothetical protein